MDRRQRSGLAALLILNGCAGLGFFYCSASAEPVPTPSSFSGTPAPSVSPVAPTSKPGALVTPSLLPKAGATGKPSTLEPALRPASGDRANTAGLSNPRPWEWRWWTQDERIPGRASGNVMPPMAPPINNATPPSPEDSAALLAAAEQLPNDERAAFLRNFKRWALLTEGERQTLRRQADDRHQRMQEEMEGALRESGLQLDEDHREIFMLRYGQERRKLERELQEKLAAERARRTPELIQRIRREFEPTSTPTPSPTVASTPRL